LLTLYVWRQTPGHDWYDGDCAMYLTHARGLAEGLPYAQTACVPQPETFENGEFEIYEARRSAPHASYLPTAWNL
jgi:hypothetical protein